MLSNSNNEQNITHVCLIANEKVENRETSENNDDNNACTSHDAEEEEKTGNDILNEVYNFLNNYSKRNLVKILLCYIRCQEGYILKSNI